MRTLLGVVWVCSDQYAGGRRSVQYTLFVVLSFESFLGRARGDGHTTLTCPSLKLLGLGGGQVQLPRLVLVNHVDVGAWV